MELDGEGAVSGSIPCTLLFLSLALEDERGMLSISLCIGIFI